MGSPTRALLRGLLFLLWSLTVIPLQAVALAIGSRHARRIPLVFHRWVCRLLGLRVETRGEVSRVRPTLFVCNHASYVDVAVLGALVDGSFIAKRGIAAWPFFGLLAKLQRSIFIERRLPFAGEQVDEMRCRLEAGDNLLLFPEGTSGDGTHVLPFKSSLFAVAEEKVNGKPLVVQPVSLAYAEIDGIPMGRWLRPLVAWYGSMNLMGHMWRLAGLGEITAVVTFHPPVTVEGFADRKALSAYCRRVIAEGLANALSGREPVDVEATGPSRPARPDRGAPDEPVLYSLNFLRDESLPRRAGPGEGGVRR